MYKIKIINYRAYEYEIFQEQLNQLGKNGYLCKDLSFISIFKKVNHPVYYKIDFFHQTGKTKTEKNILKDQFYDPYLDACFEPVYAKKEMYVFMGEQDAHIDINWNQKKDTISEKRKIKNLNYFVGSLLVTLFFIIGTLFNITINTFLTYGITIAYIGIICLGITTIYRNFLNLYYSSQMSKQLQKKQPHLSTKKLKKLRITYATTLFLSLFLIFGGLIEDTVNAKEFSLKEHPILTLSQLNISEESQLSYQKQSSFTVPNSYSILEIGDKESVLYVKEYFLRSTQAATQLFEDFYNDPQEYLCTSVTLNHNVIYGYYEDELTTLIIKKDNQVTLVSVTFSLTDEQVNTIIRFYS